MKDFELTGPNLQHFRVENLDVLKILYEWDYTMLVLLTVF